MSIPILRRIDKDDTKSIAQAVADGFDFIGTLHSYALDIYLDEIVIQDALQTDLDRCIEIGRAALRHSRWVADPKIPDKAAQQVYEQRIREAFQSARVWVAWHPVDLVIGFCVLEDNELTLIAVSRDYQGRGVGTRLVQVCIQECERTGKGQLIVKTQGRNRQGRNFYEKLGFKRFRIEKDFHKHENSADGG